MLTECCHVAAAAAGNAHRDCWDVVGVCLLGIDDKGDSWLDGDGDVVGTSTQHTLHWNIPLSAQHKARCYCC